MYYYVLSDALYHHGIKGQKWGVRRYQNPDGSFTDEGRRRYGYGKGSLDSMTENTADKIAKGAKIGVGVGVASGVLSTASQAAIYSMLGVAAPPAVLIGAGTSFIASGALGGLVNGTVVGSIVGAVSTSRGRKHLEKYDKGLREFEVRDLKVGNYD